MNTSEGNIRTELFYQQAITEKALYQFKFEKLLEFHKKLKTELSY